jgi:hypothetical protein
LPNESEDVKNKYPSVFDKLIDAYNDWKEETDTKNNWESKEVKLDEKMEDHLRDMGYLE